MGAGTPARGRFALLRTGRDGRTVGTVAGAVYLVRSDLRHRWPAALLLGVLIGLAGAVVVTGVSGARRGPAAFDAFDAAYPPPDVSAFPIDPADLDDVQEAVAGTPGVQDWFTASFVGLGEVGSDGTIDGAFGGGLPIDLGTGADLARFLDGGAPVGPYEFAVNEPVARRLSLVPGDRVPLAVYGAAQIDLVGNGQQAAPAHGVRDFTVSGIFRLPADLKFRTASINGGEGETVQWSSALWDRYDGDLANYGVGVIATVAAGVDPADVTDSLTADLGGRAYIQEGDDSADTGPIARIIDLQSTALLVAIGVVAVVALALGLQALSRQVAGLGLGNPVLGALGVDRPSSGWAAGLWALIVGLVGVPVLIGGSLVGSLAMPIGVAARADFTDGATLDLPVVIVSITLIVGGLVAWGVVAGRSLRRPRPPRRARRPSALQSVLRFTGRPVPVVGTALSAGTNHEAGRVPNRTAIVGLAVGMAGTVAALVFGASLSHLTTDPESFGWSWDVSVANCSTVECTDEAAALLEDNPDVAAYTGFNEGTATVNGGPTGGVQYVLGRGWAGGEILEGSPPAGAHDAVLATATARDLGVGVGDEIEVTAEGAPPVSFRVSGIFVPPAALSDGVTLSEGAGITSRGLRRATPDLPAAASRRAQYFLVRFDPEADRDEALARLREDFPTTLLEPLRTDDIEGMYRLRRLPALLAALVGLLAFLTLMHFVVATARRRRSALATVQAFGGRRGLGRGALAWHATLVALAGVLIGVPVGVAVGRTGWIAAADALEVEVGPVIPVAALALLVVTVVAAAAVLGWTSYRLRSRSPALALRGD